MLVELKHAWNPDYVGGYRALVRRPKKPQVMVVPTFAAASKACLAYIAHYQLGGGNWAGGLVWDDERNVIARVSYNGRVWKCNSVAESMKFPLPEIDITQEAQHG